MSHDFVPRDASVLGRWWGSVDRLLFGSTLLLILIGVLLSFSASPCTASRIGFARFFFVKHHLLLVPVSVILMIAVSLLSPTNIRKFTFLAFLGGVIALILTFFAGYETKGARRWLIIFGFSLQPSEFVKPTLAVVVAWLLAKKQQDFQFPGIQISCCLVGFILAILVSQPDIGMTTLTLASFLVQLFIAGMPLLLVFGSISLGLLGLILSYFFVPHVTKRIDAFLNPALSDPDQMYQVRQSLEAFHHGRWFGCGPGEGIVKNLVPDAHSDFVFSVAGEEYGLLFCLLIVALFSFIIVRSLLISMRSQNFFISFAVTGIVTQLGLQAFINMATTLHLIPTKGMTIPFISYGGSSLLAVSLAMGIVLALTRRKYGQTTYMS